MSHMAMVKYLSFRKQGHERIQFPYGWTAWKR